MKWAAPPPHAHPNPPPSLPGHGARRVPCNRRGVTCECRSSRTTRCPERAATGTDCTASFHGGARGGERRNRRRVLWRDARLPWGTCRRAMLPSTPPPRHPTTDSECSDQVPASHFENIEGRERIIAWRIRCSSSRKQARWWVAASRRSKRAGRPGALFALSRGGPAASGLVLYLYGSRVRALRPAARRRTVTSRAAALRAREAPTVRRGRAPESHSERSGISSMTSATRCGPVEGRFASTTTACHCRHATAAADCASSHDALERNSGSASARPAPKGVRLLRTSSACSPRSTPRSRPLAPRIARQRACHPSSSTAVGAALPSSSDAPPGRAAARRRRPLRAVGAAQSHRAPSASCDGERSPKAARCPRPLRRPASPASSPPRPRPPSVASRHSPWSRRPTATQPACAASSSPCCAASSPRSPPRSHA